MSAVEWNEVTGPRSQGFRVLSDRLRQQLDRQLMPFIPVKTKCLAPVSMRGGHVLMRDEVANYHGRVTSRN